jgi:hypothetical protein
MKRNQRPSTDEVEAKKKKFDDYEIFKQKFEAQW